MAITVAQINLDDLQKRELVAAVKAVELMRHGLLLLLVLQDAFGKYFFCICPHFQ